MGTLSRRRFLTMAGASAVAATPIFRVYETLAGVAWCRRDPIVRLNGTVVQVWVAVPEEYVPLVNGPVRLQVKTPEAVVQELLLTDDGFNGYGEVVSFGTIGTNDRKVQGATFATLFNARVPVASATPVPVMMEIIPANGQTAWIYGDSNSTQVMTTVTGAWNVGG